MPVNKPMVLTGLHMMDQVLEPLPSPPSHWSFECKDGELDMGDLEEEDEEVQAGDRQYVREDTPTVGYVPLPDWQPSLSRSLDRTKLASISDTSRTVHLSLPTIWARLSMTQLPEHRSKSVLDQPVPDANRAKVLTLPLQAKNKDLTLIDPRLRNLAKDIEAPQVRFRRLNDYASKQTS